MAHVARTLERDSAARFAIYADDLTVWVEAAEFSDPDHMLDELQGAANSSSDILPTLGLELAPENTEFFLVHGRHRLPPDMRKVIYLGDKPVSYKSGQIRILGVPLASNNSNKCWISHLKGPCGQNTSLVYSEDCIVRTILTPLST